MRRHNSLPTMLALLLSLTVAGCGVQDSGALSRGGTTVDGSAATAGSPSPSQEPLRYAEPASQPQEPAAAAPAAGDHESASGDKPGAAADHATASPNAAGKPVDELARSRGKQDSRTAGRELAPPPAPAAESLRKAQEDQLGERLVAPLGGTGPGTAGDRFDHLPENAFAPVSAQPLSTFSIDVDTASYAKTRRYLLQNNALPPPDAVRIEEFVNYFDYDYESPGDEHPFAVAVETADCPWKPGHQLARIGIQGRRIENQRPASNLVFLMDVSGSMDRPDKLPLVKQALNMLVSRLGENDRVAIVVYAGAAGLVLPPTLGDQRSTIEGALDRLHAGGSTNGGQGIHLAYQTALENFIPGGVNRVLLCTDGDFNVGTTSTGELVRLAEQQAKADVFLSVLAFGQGNHNDAMLEQLSNKANGNYAFIDTAAEAHKVLVEQMSGTLVTIAKDVKLQVEFNPARVAAYRLIGYENRALAARDFNDDKKDAGEIGAGHQVTALYELVPAGENGDNLGGDVDPLKYQKQELRGEGTHGDELMTVKVRYKLPEEDQSTLLQVPVPVTSRRFGEASQDFQFASAVASFGMLLRRSEHRGDAGYLSVWEIASSALGKDRHGYRREFLDMVRQAGRLDDQFPADALEGLSIPPRDTHWKPGSSNHTHPVVHRRHAVSPASNQPALRNVGWARQLLTSGRIFWGGAIFGLLASSAIILGCRWLSRSVQTDHGSLKPYVKSPNPR